MSRFLALALAVSAPSCDAFDGNSVCTLAGCDSDVYLPEIDTNVGSRLIGATLRACRNELCSEAQIFSLPTEAEWEGPRLLMEGELVVKAHVYTLPTEHTVTARILAQGDYPHGLADGDVYSLMLRDSTSVLSEKSWTATYRVLEPNGHECGPTCLSATLVETTPVGP